MLSTASTLRRPGQPLRAPRVAASVLAKTRRRTRRPCVSSKASQSARLGAPTWKQYSLKCSTTAAWAREQGLRMKLCLGLHRVHQLSDQELEHVAVVPGCLLPPGAHAGL